MSSAFCLSQLLDENDIDFAFITEHKLLPRSSMFLDSIHSSYYSLYTIDDSIDQYGQAKCGKAGTAILYKKSLHCIVTKIENIDNNRIIGIKLQCDNALPMYLFCIYMPACSDTVLYASTLSDVEALVTYYSTEGTVILAGDFNAQYSTHGAPENIKSKMLMNFMEKHSLMSVQYLNDELNRYTYIPKRTTIDHILIESTNKACVLDFNVMKEDDILTSDHVPILAKLKSSTALPATQTRVPSTAWNKCTDDDMTKYQDRLSQCLTCLQEENIQDDPNLLNTYVVEAMRAAEQQLPRSRFNKNAKPYWCESLKELHRTAKKLRKSWVTKGKPRGHSFESYTKYKTAKSQFRKLQRQKQAEYEQKSYDELNKAADIDYRLFWKLLNKKKCRRTDTCNELKVESTTYTGDEIVDGFKNYYKQVFDCDNITTRRDADMENYVRLNTVVECKENKGLINDVTVSEIRKATSTLKKQKAPGIDDICSEHILHGGAIATVAITTLFNSIIKHEYIPDAWKTSIIIPIYKGKGKSKNDPNNYRPISLIPVLCKLFERVMLNRLQEHMRSRPQRFPAVQQQGFQEGLSCVTTSFNLQETVHHTIEKGSNAYVACLDQKAAFDSVWHTGLFHKMCELGLTGKILRLLIAAYTRLKCVVRVNGKTSDSIDVKRSVRQGGVMSTFLYLIYINPLLLELEKSNYGCTVYSVRGGNPSFADDIALVATTPYNLQRLVDIVYMYGKEWKLELNARKSTTMVFTHRRSAIKIGIMYESNFLEQQTFMIHLGIRLDANLRLTPRIDERIQKARNAFFAMATQGVHPQGVNPLVSISLYKTIIKPIVLYGSELWTNMTQAETYALNKFQHFVVKKILGLSVQTRSDMCESMVGLHKLKYDIDVKKLIFLHKILSFDSANVSRNIFIRRYYAYVSGNSHVRYGFVPDICNILINYQLQDFVNQCLTNPNSIPNKTSWKTKVKRNVYSKAEGEWQRRVQRSNDFECFKILHPVVKPAIVYDICKNSSSRQTMQLITKLWCRPKAKTDSVCDRCSTGCSDVTVHKLSVCIANSQARAMLQQELVKFGVAFSTQLYALSPTQLTNRLLGAPIVPFLEDIDNLEFLRIAFGYVYKCCN